MREAAKFNMNHNKEIDDIDEQIKQLKGKGIKVFFFLIDKQKKKELEKKKKIN